MTTDLLYQAMAVTALERRLPEVASLLGTSQPASTAVAFVERLPAKRAAELLRWTNPDLSAELIGAMRIERSASVLVELGPSRAASLLARLKPEILESVLLALPDEVGREIRELLDYPRDSAGRLMDPRATAFSPETTVREVVKTLRVLKRKRITDVLLLDSEGQLVGMVSLQDIVLADVGARLADLVVGRVPSVYATDPRERVMEVLDEHRVATLPVVDFDGRLLGVLRHQQLVEAAEQVASADMLTMVGASREERALSRPWFAIKKRLPWLQLNLLTAFLAAAVVGAFEDTIAKVTALAVLLPVVAGQSGNTGAQALAVTMRGLALREVRTRHWVRVAIKEVTVGASNGVAVALTTGLAVLVWSQSTGLAAVIAVSMVLSMIAAAFAGAIIPMALTAIRQDPAQSSSIILTTVTDVVGFLSFLGIATIFASYLPPT